MDKITIRALSTDDSIAELTNVLHAAYAQLADMGFNYTAVDQSNAVTQRRLVDGDCFVALDTKQLIGTILYHRNGNGCPYYEQPHVGIVNQFGVLPDYQRKGIGSQLMQVAELRARDTGVRELALDTSEGAHHLTAWYERLGYSVVEHVHWPGKTYRSVIMSKVIEGV